MQLVMGAEC